MNNRKSTKRALLTSLLSLLLCCSMLIGTTFAWFTDEVTSAKNQIVAGNLDVELYYMNDETSDWTKVTAESNIFKQKTLWEPGHTEVIKLKVVNEGTLALKYQLGVNVASEIGSVNVEGKDFKLSDFIKFGIVEGNQTYTRDQAVAAVDATATALKMAYASGTMSLASKEEKIVTMVVYMPTSVGNEANYAKGEAIPTINLGINLFATQLQAENDSFGPDYDEDAWAPDMVVTTASELMTAIENVKDGGIIALAEDLIFDEDSRTHNSANWYDGLYYVGDKSFTIDLNGKTITNDSTVNDYLLNFKNDGTKANTITIKNGTIEAGSSAYCAICTATSSTQKITINLEDVKVIGNNSNGSVVKIRGGAELNVKAGTVITGKDSYLGIENSAATVNIYDGAEIYQNGTSSYNGCLVGVGSNGTVNVYGGYGKGVAGAFIAMTSGGTINVYGGEWIADTDGTFSGNDYVLIAQSDKATYAGDDSIINVTGGTFSGGYNCYGNAVGDAQINISAGTFNADPTAYVATGFKAVESNGKYVVVSDTIADENVVSTPDELKAALSGAADAGSGDNTIYLNGDIDLTGTTWESISVDGYHGAGIITIEGNGATIKGLTAPLFAGGFAGKSGIVIKNLTIADSNIVSTSGLGGGAFIDTADSMQVITLENCHLVNSTVTGERTGGLIGWCSGYAKLDDGPVKTYVTISNCSVVDSTVIGAGSAGAIAGHPGASDYTYTTIENCVVKNVDVVSNDDGSWRTGAIVGTANNGHIVINNVTVEDVTLTQNGVAAETIVLYGRFVPSGTGTLVIDGAQVVTTNEELKAAIEAGQEDIYLPAGNYTMPEPDLRGKTLTIKGTKDTVIDVSAVDARDQFVTGATIVFDGVTLNFGKVNYMGFANTASLTYKNCTINGLQFLYGANVAFENCDLNSNGAEHCVWTYGAQNVSFTGCDFTYGDRGINCYGDNDVTGGKQTVNFTNCTFATENTASEGAVEINSSRFSVGIEVNMTGCTAPAYGEMAYVSPWDSNNGAKTTINIK